MAIIGKSEKHGRSPRDLGDLDRDNAPTRGRQRGMSGHTQFDFSEEALLSGDSFAQNGSHGRDEKSSPHHEDKTKRGDDPRPKNKDAETVLAMASGLLAKGELTIGAAAPQTISVSAPGGAVDEIMLRIEQAVRASLHSGEATPLAFKVKLDDLHIPGLKSLHVSMSAGALDVSVGRDAGMLTPEILSAAQSLADQLAVRFPTRVVRVLDLDSDADRAGDHDGSHSGLRAISELLTHRGGTS